MGVILILLENFSLILELWLPVLKTLTQDGGGSLEKIYVRLFQGGPRRGMVLGMTSASGTYQEKAYGVTALSQFLWRFHVSVSIIVRMFFHLKPLICLLQAPTFFKGVPSLSNKLLWRSKSENQWFSNLAARELFRKQKKLMPWPYSQRFTSSRVGLRHQHF